jgi:cobalt-zinc-cadmium efflux system outer membrane protein
MKRIILILYVMFLIGGQTFARAEDPSVLAKPDELHLLIEEALKSNPEIKAAHEQWKAAQKRVPQASSLPDPTAGYAFMGPSIETRNGPIMDNYNFEQMIPFPGKLAGRRNAAKAEAAAAEAKMKMVEREIIFKVSEAYYDLVTTQSSIVLVGTIDNALKESQSAMQARYLTSMGTQSELLKTQMAVAENTQRLFDFEQKRDTLRIFLQSLLDRSEPVEVPMENLHLPKVKLVWEDVRRKAKENRPELKESIAMVQKSRHDLNLAKLENAPDFSVGFEYSRIGVGDSSSMNAGRDAWMIPIKITLPIWQNRIGSSIEEAHANLNAAQAKLKQAENSTEYEVKAAYYRFVTAQKTVLLYESTLGPQSHLMLQSDNAGYVGKQVNEESFVSSQINFFNTKIAYFEALANALKAFAALQREVGQDLTEESSYEIVP